MDILIKEAAAEGVVDGAMLDVKGMLKNFPLGFAVGEGDMKPKAPGALCSQCPYKDQPFVPPAGPKRTTHAIVGMAPHKQEVREGEPFVGPSGRLLNAALLEVGLNRADIRIDNLVLCQPVRGTDPDPEAIECCRPRLHRGLKDAGVEYLLAMSALARSELLPQEMQGVWNVWNGCVVDPSIRAMATYHPAHALRGNPSAFTDILLAVEKFAVAPEEVPQVKYVVLNTHAELARVLDKLAQWPHSACFDLETTNVDMKRSTPGEWWNGYVLCMGISWQPGVAYVISEELFNSKKTLQMLKSALERSSGWYGHNPKYDMLYLMRYYGDNLDMHLVDDTLLQHFTLDERRGTHGLKELSGLYFDQPDYDAPIHGHLRRPKVDSYALAPRDVLYKYAAMDVDFTVRLKVRLEKDLDKNDLRLWPYLRVIAPAIQALVRVERRGMHMDQKRLAEVRDAMANKVVELRDELRTISGEQGLNPNAPAQLSKIIYGKLGFKTPKGRKVKEGSTNKEVLTKLRGQHPFIDALSSYRRWAKLFSTYANKLHEHCDQKGSAHFQFNLAGSVTGRLEAGLLLTIPRAYTPEGKMIRECFAARPGYTLVAGDFSQAELRWMGWFAQEPFLYEVYENDRDLHSEVAAAMFGLDFTKEHRIQTKMFNFAYAYGGTEYSFAADAALPIEKARAWVRQYNQLMPRAAAWKKETWDLVRAQGWLRTPTGRRRRFSLITPDKQHETHNQAINFPVQSISSDVTLMAFTNLCEYFRKMGWDAHGVLFLHDGIYFEVKNDPVLVKKVGAKVREVMLSTADYVQKGAGERFEEYRGFKYMPFKVDIDSGPNWGSLKKLEC